MFYGLWSKGPQMTVIVKHLTDWGDTPSPSSFGDERRAGVWRRLNGKRLNARFQSLPASISDLWGQGLHPRGSKGGHRSKTRKKRGRETLVMDKPVVSVGEPGGEGAVVGVGR